MRVRTCTHARTHACTCIQTHTQAPTDANKNEVHKYMYIAPHTKRTHAHPGVHTHTQDRVDEHTFRTHCSSRTCLVAATVPCKLWAIDRQCFQSIMVKTGLLRNNENKQLLKRYVACRQLTHETFESVKSKLPLTNQTLSRSF